MENMAGMESRDPRRWLIAECAGHLVEALQSMTSRPCQAEWLPDASVEPRPDSWWRQPLNLGAGAEVWVGAADPVWTAIGDKALKAAGIDDGEPADLKSTYHEILTQALSATAQSIGNRLGREVVCQPGQATPEAPAAGSPHTVEIRFEDGETVRVAIWFGDTLLAGIQAVESAQEQEEGPSPDRALAPPLPSSLDGSKTLDLLLEVELPVSISFGRAQLPLKDVLKLTTGSIVELNRSVSEPVEVIVNNCVIARGEVVVIEGNYGVRIHEIISRQERLRSLN